MNIRAKITVCGGQFNCVLALFWKWWRQTVAVTITVTMVVAEKVTERLAAAVILMALVNSSGFTV